MEELGSGIPGYVLLGIIESLKGVLRARAGRYFQELSIRWDLSVADSQGIVYCRELTDLLSGKVENSSGRA